MTAYVLGGVRNACKLDMNLGTVRQKVGFKAAPFA